MSRLSFGASSHVGLKRAHNEDAFVARPELGLFAVCDGMGGHSSGEVASRLACDELAQFFELTEADPEATWPWRAERHLSEPENRLVTGVRLANRTIYETSVDQARLRGMGTTAVGLAFELGRVVVAHAGDSRAYLYRDTTLSRLTDDHSLVEEYLRSGRLTVEEAKTFPQRNIILRALGQAPDVDVEVRSHRLEEGDVLLLCSDGLSGMLEDEEMERLLQRLSSDLENCAHQLVREANAAGGLDNITCILVRWRRA